MVESTFISIGIPFDVNGFEHYDFGDAPTLSDYDVVVADLDDISEFIGKIDLVTRLHRR